MRGAPAERLARVRANVARACESAGRAPSDVRIVAASKYADVEEIRALADAGQEDFGENYVQSALAKMRSVQRPNLRLKRRFIIYKVIRTSFTSK